LKTYRIPFNRPGFAGNELQRITQALATGHISGDGPFTNKCEATLQEELAGKRVLLTTSCTHALEMTAILLDIGPEDEVIVPSFTFVSTANAYALRGAKIVFCDVRGDTLNLDEHKLEELITSRTRAVVPVHYAGVGCEMDAICEIAGTRGVAVVEDNAHGLFGQYRKRPLGTLGSLATLSFHETKNLTCGEGGALLVNDESLIDRAEIIREKGTNRRRFFRGQVDKYTWVDLGSSYVPSDVLAAFLYAQLEARNEIQRRRRQIWNRYFEGLKEWAKPLDIRLPHVPAHCDQAYHMFFMILPTPEVRAALGAWLKERGILAVFHYQPLHLSEMGRSFGGEPGACPITEEVSARIIRLPFFNIMSDEDQQEVIEALLAFGA